MIFITQISLENWFNYEGGFEKNTIPFARGVNFFCADNNAGKSKLHNAIRWVLSEKIIINSQLEEIENDTIEQVVNRSYYRQLNAGETFQCGVQLDYTKTTGHNEARFRILKRIKGSKDGQWTIQNEVLKPGRGNGWIKSQDANESINRNHFIPEKFQRYLFLEGEQLNNLIPFSGHELNATIDDITNIHSIDKRIERTQNVKKALISIRDEENKKLNRGNAALQNAIEKRSQLNSQLYRETQERKEISNKLNKLKAKKLDLKQESEKMERTQEAIKQLDQYDFLSNATQRRIEELENDYYANISRKFKISHFLTTTQSTSFINDKYRDLLNEFIATRKSQLDDNIDEAKQKMVARLIKNQPGIEILNEIVEGKSCFVCGTSPISTESEKYITDHLIPHFSGEFDQKDDQLSLFNAVNQLTNSAIKGIQNFQPDETPFEEILEAIAQKQNEAHGIDNNRLDFIQKNGDPREAQADTSIIEEYEKLSNEIHDKEDELEQLASNVERLENEIQEYEKIIRQNSGASNDSLERLEQAVVFEEKLYKTLEIIKERTYMEFCSKLEVESTRRLHRYFGNNPGIQNSKFKVLVEKAVTGNYGFSISVQDKNGNLLTDPGGAETKIRQYCVVLSLVELANESSGQIGNFPFIIDAPISQLNADYRLQFYKSLLEETVNSQTIILTYDLVTGAPNSIINEDGKQLLSLMKGDASANSGHMLYKRDRDAEVVIHQND